ncbi:hypothetical protein [Lysobacter sp. F6437]|uniref:hypothetical protein n=1 Tax=Lysobacter sp. F6437 TaxID=3459296 RepID=UPI00403E2614
MQAKIKPTAEIQILVGGPYVKDGEEHRYGHTALRVKSKTADLTYDFGRYGATRGAFGETGDGILRIWTDFDSYIRGENALHRITTGFVYYVFDHQASAANGFFNEKIRTATPLPRKNRAGMKAYKLATDYHALGPNCTTLSIDGAKAAIKNIDRGSDAFNKPEEVLNWKELLGLSAKGGSDRLFLPANLQEFLAAQRAIKVSRTDEYGGS